MRPRFISADRQICDGFHGGDRGARPREEEGPEARVIEEDLLAPPDAAIGGVDGVPEGGLATEAAPAFADLRVGTGTSVVKRSKPAAQSQNRTAKAGAGNFEGDTCSKRLRLAEIRAGEWLTARPIEKLQPHACPAHAPR